MTDPLKKGTRDTPPRLQQRSLHEELGNYTNQDVSLEGEKGWEKLFMKRWGCRDLT